MQVLVAAGVVVSTSAADPPGGGGVLCGITNPTDRLLNCLDESSAPTGAPASVAGSTDQQQRPDQQVRTVPPTPRYMPGLLLLTFKPGTPANRRQQVMKAAGVTVERHIDQIDAVVVRVSPERRDLFSAG